MTTILFDATRTVKPATSRRFGAGIARDPYAPNECHWGSLALPRPLPWVPTIHETTTHEQAYEAACQAVAGRRAEWISSAPASWKALARRRENDRLDRMAEESAAMDRHERGLIFA
jgi:hypothetical protein